eukprot:gene766-1178_t
MGDNEADAQYVVSTTLAHDADVRWVAPYPGIEGGVLSGSYDKTARAWQVSGRGQAETLVTFAGHTHWVACVMYLPDGLTGTGGPSVITSGWDKNVIVWDIDAATPVWVLDGHDDKVTAMAAATTRDPADGSAVVTLATAGYDKVVILWKNGALYKRLTKHTSAVSCACALPGPAGEFVTGGAHGDNSLIRWSNKGEFLRQYQVHTSGVRGVVAVSDVLFASCSNDTTLVLWSTATNEALRKYVGHTNQVYSVASLANPAVRGGASLLASVSEDKTVKIWDQESAACLQTIPMPSALFCVAALSNADLVVACTDGTARVLTTAGDRIASEEKLKEFNDLVANQKLKKSGLGGLDMAALPGPDALNTPGTGDNQQKIIKRGDGAEVYQWNAAAKAWEKVGDVVDQEDSSGPLGIPGAAAAEGAGEKKRYKGKDWDYLFDVDLGTGPTGTGQGHMFKLPYNKGENPYVAAQRFLHDNVESGIHQGHLDDVAKFIMTNVEGAESLEGADADACASEFAKEAAARRSAAAGPSGSSGGAAAPAGSAFSAYAKEAAAAAGGSASSSVAENMKRMQERNENVAFSTFAQEAANLKRSGPSAPQADQDLPDGVEGAFVLFEAVNAAGMAKKIAQINGEMKAAALSADQLALLTTAIEKTCATGSHPGPEALRASGELLRAFEQGKRFAVIDFVRFCLTKPGLAADVLADPALNTIPCLLTPSASPAAGVEQTCCLKAACNLFATDAGKAFFNDSRVLSHVVQQLSDEQSKSRRPEKLRVLWMRKETVKGTPEDYPTPHNHRSGRARRSRRVVPCLHFSSTRHDFIEQARYELSTPAVVQGMASKLRANEQAGVAELVKVLCQALLFVREPEIQATLLCCL